jgi:ribosomal protein L32
MIEEQYQEAYDKAPEETKRAIEKFEQMPKSFRDKKPLLYYILGAGTPPYKMSKRASAYVDKASGEINLMHRVNPETGMYKGRKVMKGTKDEA